MPQITTKPKDLQVARLYNFDDDSKSTSIWTGTPRGLIDLQSTNHPKMNVYYKQMRLDFWNPYNFAASDYVKLQEHGKVREIERVLSYLSFLDSLQVRVIPEFGRFVTDNTTKVTLAEHAAVEAMHCASYQYMISNFPHHSREYIRTGVEVDPLLMDRCEYITEPYQAYLDNPTPETLMRAYFADYLIEGFLFQTGFNFFFQNVSSLADSVIIIKLISRK